MNDDWTRDVRDGSDEWRSRLDALQAYLTPWPGALRALGGLQSKRVGAPVRVELAAWCVTLEESGALDSEGRLTALGAALAVEESDRMFRDLFDI